jgi:hypothetical protein
MARMHRISVIPFADDDKEKTTGCMDKSEFFAKVEKWIREFTPRGYKNDPVKQRRYDNYFTANSLSLFVNFLPHLIINKQKKPSKNDKIFKKFQKLTNL